MSFNYDGAYLYHLRPLWTLELALWNATPQTRDVTPTLSQYTGTEPNCHCAIHCCVDAQLDITTFQVNDLDVTRPKNHIPGLLRMKQAVLLFAIARVHSEKLGRSTAPIRYWSLVRTKSAHPRWLLFGKQPLVWWIVFIAPTDFCILCKPIPSYYQQWFFHSISLIFRAALVCDRVKVGELF